MIAYFERFTFELSETDAFIGSHTGRCDEDILYLRTIPYIAQQLHDLNPKDLAAELAEYGAWDDALLLPIFPLLTTEELNRETLRLSDSFSSE